MMNILANLCGATITDKLKKGIASLPENDKDGLVAFGVDFAAKQCRELIEKDVPGLHIYTMDRAVSAQRLVKKLRNEGHI